VLEICKDMKLETIYAIMLSDNYRAISLMKKMGFVTEYLNDGTVKAILNLREEELASCIEPGIAEEPQLETKQLQAEKKEKKEAEVVQG
jgi:RimJ/RimL family protein N-acetyltransferase